MTVKQVGLDLCEEFWVFSQESIKTDHRRVNQMLLLGVVKADQVDHERL
jgi:hypothetical protein